MKKYIVIIIAACAAAALIGLLLHRQALPQEQQVPGRTATITEAPFELWTVSEGEIESLNMQVIMSRFKGKTTIIYLAPEGSAVTQDTLLVEFESATLEQDIEKLQHDLRSAKADLNSQRNAELPMEIAELENQIAETRFNYESEVNYLDDSHELVADGLISTQEVVQQQHKVDSLDATLNQLETKKELTEKYLHPARLQQAEDLVAKLETELEAAREQFAECRIYSPASGMVTYAPLHISGEYRTVRIGDSVNQNQPFMHLPDMTNLVVQCYIPEADLALAQPGFPAKITPVSFPDLTLRGEVINIGAMAQRRPGKPRWQKYFIITVSLNDFDPRLRTGMSAEVSIRSAHETHALLIPRTAVYWDTEQPYCMMIENSSLPQRRDLVLGPANDFYYVVESGVAPGDLVMLQPIHKK
jgi:multidrug resistance efflux pump